MERYIVRCQTPTQLPIKLGQVKLYEQTQAAMILPPIAIHWDLNRPAEPYITDPTNPRSACITNTVLKLRYGRTGVTAIETRSAPPTMSPAVIAGEKGPSRSSSASSTKGLLCQIKSLLSWKISLLSW